MTSKDTDHWRDAAKQLAKMAGEVAPKQRAAWLDGQAGDVRTGKIRLAGGGELHGEPKLRREVDRLLEREGA